MALLQLKRPGSGDITNFRRDMDDLFNSFFGSFPAVGSDKNVWPAIDVAEDENSITVKAEVPGCNAEDIDISVHGDMLTISGEKKYEDEKKEKGYYHMERSYGKFQRQLRLSSEVEAEKIEAACKNGVLSLNLPKAAQAKAHKIKVKGQ